MKETGERRMFANIFPLKLEDNWIKDLEIWRRINHDDTLRVIKYDTNLIKGSRKESVIKWENAPAEILYYPSGEYRDPLGELHKYGYGSRLYVGEEKQEVMDTCERPWSEETVYGLFKGYPDSISPLAEKEPAVLLRGFGLGEQAQLILNELVTRGGGELHIAELNRDIVNNSVRNFLEENKQLIQQSFRYGLKPKTRITIHIGDAYQVTEQLLEKKRNLI